MLSEEIKLRRRGTITASEAHRCMTGWDAPRPPADYPEPIYDWIVENGRKPAVTPLKESLECDVSMKLIDAAWKAYQFEKVPTGLITYGEELAARAMFWDDPDEPDISNMPHVRNGNERELDAVRLLEDATGIKFINTGENQRHFSESGIGATPDGLTLDEIDMFAAGCEVKARSRLHHARQLLIRDNASMIDMDFERYCQCQVGMFVIGVSIWYSAGYNPLALNKIHEFNWCVIDRDEKFLAIFKKRAALVFKYKQAFIDARTPAGVTTTLMEKKIAHTE